MGIEEMQKAREADDVEQSSEFCESMTRTVYDRAYFCMHKDISKHKEEAIIVLEAWRDFEQSCITESEEKHFQRMEEVQKKMPRKVKRKRPYYSDDGQKAGMEEYWDYLFPDDSTTTPGLLLLDAAYRWKKRIQQITFNRKLSREHAIYSSRKN